MGLTPRQLEIQQLLDADKTPGEVAAALGISTNAVYQQMRRIKEGGGAPRTTKGGRKPAGKAQAATPVAKLAAAVPAPPKAEPAHGLTPLQTIRARKAEIETELKVWQGHVDAAAKALGTTAAGHEKLTGKYGEELARLTQAENALRGIAPTPAAAPVTSATSSAAAKAGVAPVPRGGKAKGGKSALAPAPAAPASAAAAPAAEAPAPTNGSQSDTSGFIQTGAEA